MLCTCLPSLALIITSVSHHHHHHHDLFIPSYILSYLPNIPLLSFIIPRVAGLRLTALLFFLFLSLSHPTMYIMHAMPIYTQYQYQYPVLNTRPTHLPFSAHYTLIHHSAPPIHRNTNTERILRMHPDRPYTHFNRVSCSVSGLLNPDSRRAKLCLCHHLFRHLRRPFLPFFLHSDCASGPRYHFLSPFAL